MSRGHVMLATLLAACATERAGVDPPGSAFFFPSGLAVSPEGRWLFVANANSDLAYNAGTLVAIDLDRVGEGCAPNPVEAGSDFCDEEGAGFIADRVRIGSFAADVRLRGDGRRIYVAVRSDPRSLTWIDWDPLDQAGPLLCAQEEADEDACGGRHVVTAIEGGDASLDLPSEPFGLYLHEVPDLAPRLLVAHLSRPYVTVLDDCGDELRAIDTSDALFAADQRGQNGGYAVAQRPGEGDEGPFYVTSRVSSAIATVAVDPPEARCDGTARVISGSGFALAGLADGSDARGIAFVGSDRAYVVDREPSALVELDTTLEDGRPRNRTLRTVEVCPEPTAVLVEPRADARTVLWVPCFATSQIFVVDGELMQLVDVIPTGRGPAAVAFDPVRPLAYVTHFGENTVGLIDLDPDGARYLRLSRRLGVPEPLR